MEEKEIETQTVENAANTDHRKSHEARIVPLAEEAQEDARHINLSWRSWIVVFFCCWAIMAQVFVVVAAGSVIAFIIRDLGEPAIAGWIIQVLHSPYQE
jgi:hypothetical protein